MDNSGACVRDTHSNPFSLLTLRAVWGGGSGVELIVTHSEWEVLISGLHHNMRSSNLMVSSSSALVMRNIGRADQGREKVALVEVPSPAHLPRSPAQHRGGRVVGTQVDPPGGGGEQPLMPSGGNDTLIASRSLVLAAPNSSSNDTPLEIFPRGCLWGWWW